MNQNSPLRELRHWPNWLLGLLVGSWVMRLLIAWLLPPGFDEAYYFLYTQHWDWSYFDHPVMVALTTAVGPWLTGYISPLTLRLGALVLYGLSTGFIYLSGRRLFSSVVGMWAVAIASLCPLFIFSFGLLAAPDNALILGWSAVMYVAVLEFFPMEKPYRPTSKIALIGLLLGLTCISKYHGFILGLSLIGFCLTSAKHRQALVSPWTGAALILFLFALTPLLYWNVHHDWLSFGFHLSERFDGGNTARQTEFNLLNMVGVWLVGVAYLFPSLGFPLWWASGRSLLQLSDLRQRFVLWLGLPIALGFTLLGGVTHIYPAWPAPGLWSLSLLLALAMAGWSPSTVRRWLVGSSLVIATLLIFALGHVALGTLQRPGGLVAILPPATDPTTTMIDVVKLRHVLTESRVGDALSTADFLVTNEFWLSGYVDMAVSPITSVPVMAFTQDPRGHAVWFNPAAWLGCSGLFLSIADDDQHQIRATYAPYFERFDLLEIVETHRAGATTETFYLYDVGKLIAPYKYPY
ncbi:ArnT family glycosyltransferase [Leptothoe spongobia]|uniref:Glycosyltransferase family 39 protein n=1 Tax=Leptothoe spongobia TAU-MAC 1115 TaxID=1967444 RepID=A0A947DFC1_9CYAN|nr:glycosyltransferase family 39 protein [Leptothoe spongobia]MBT9315374.1 glycosyltransferase family 39 protein [Leptothoe spongobia TAU-MAC 1115]